MLLHKLCLGGGGVICTLKFEPNFTFQKLTLTLAILLEFLGSNESRKVNNLCIFSLIIIVIKKSKIKLRKDK